MNEIHPLDRKFADFVKSSRRFRIFVVWLVATLTQFAAGLYAMGDWYYALERSQIHYAGTVYGMISLSTSIVAGVTWGLARYE